MTTTQTLTTLLPAGTYIVGDPAYTLSGAADWDYFQEAAGDLDGDPEVLPSGRLLAVVETQEDGFYPGTDGFAYAVDSGYIGVITADENVSVQTTTYGVPLNRAYTFAQPFSVRVDHGVLHIADLHIPLYED